ncbi:MAG: hypothetical protein MJA30_26710 [Cytophagales bacterium]|nr:hypothetical protein [Cytophagales bacterium]
MKPANAWRRTDAPCYPPEVPYLFRPPYRPPESKYDFESLPPEEYWDIIHYWDMHNPIPNANACPPSRVAGLGGFSFEPG